MPNALVSSGFFYRLVDDYLHRLELPLFLPVITIDVNGRIAKLGTLCEAPPETGINDAILRLAVFLPAGRLLEKAATRPLLLMDCTTAPGGIHMGHKQQSLPPLRPNRR